MQWTRFAPGGAHVPSLAFGSFSATDADRSAAAADISPQLLGGLSRNPTVSLLAKQLACATIQPAI